MTRSSISRRDLLRTGTLAALSSLAGPSCTARIAGDLVSPSPRRLAKVNVSWERVTRTVVGLRPYRRPGFLVKAENFDGKTVIHNYGHDSRGVTLCWGTAHLAVEEAAQTGHLQYAVVGCGAVGLATARLLQRRGWSVTIYAKALPPETTSNVALGMWGPVRVPRDASPGFRDQFTRAARYSHRSFQDLVGDDYGVRWIEFYSSVGAAGLARRKDDPLAALDVDFQELGPKDHPFPSPVVHRWLSMLIEPPIFLNALMRDFQLAGGHLVVREFPDLRSLLTLPEPVIVNCTGLGARALFADEQLLPRKGQLTVLPPQPEVDYMVDIPGDMVSRKDGVLLGGTSEEGVWTLEPNQEAAQRYMTQHINFFKRMR